MESIIKTIDLCIFISSKPRFGRTEDYKVTINSFFELVNPSFFTNKFVNLKTFNGDDENSSRIIKFFEDRNFIVNIIKDSQNISDSDRENNREKFISCISTDISSFFTKFEDQLSEFVFVLEDDSPLVVKYHKGLPFLLNRGMEEIDKDNNLEGIHFPRLSYNHIPIKINEWFYHLRITQKDIDDGIVHTNYWYNFQPRVNKTKDLINVCKLILNNKDYFQYLHPESCFRLAYEHLNPNIKFKAFCPNYAYSIHLGENNEIHNLIIKSEPDILNLYKKLKII